MAKPFRILSLDGGGARGIFSAAILARLEDRGVLRVNELSMICGVSTGSILGCCLAMGVPAANLVAFYLEFAPKVFKHRKFTGADYSPDKIAEALKLVLGNSTLKDIHEKNGPILMVPAFDLTAKPVARPRVYYSNYKRDHDEVLIDIILRSTAAPAYFPVRDGMIDGGVAMNNPAMAAISYAVNGQRLKENDRAGSDGRTAGPGRKLADIRLLSVGTGLSGYRIDESEIGDGDWGLWKWKDHIADLLIESNQQAAGYYVEKMLNPQQRVRIQADLTTYGIRPAPRLDTADRDVLRRLAAAGLTEADRYIDRVARLMKD